VNRRERAVVLLLTVTLVFGIGVSYYRRARLRRRTSAVPLTVLQDTGAVPATARNAFTQLLDINLATARQLDELPGIGPILANRIVEYRQRKGGFRSVGDLRSVPGIGDRRFQTLREFVTVDSSDALDSGR